jgi:CRP-like cAMP-binding protein
VSDQGLDRVAALQCSMLLRGFTEVGIRILASVCEQRSVGRGTYAFRAGEESNALAFIARGTVQMVPREGGAALGELGPGDSMGGFALLFGGEHLLSALAATDVELLMLSRERWDALQKQKPQAALKLQLALVQDLCDRIREAKAPLREFLAWQISRRPAENR